MATAFIIISLVISSCLLLFIVAETIINKKLFTMRDLGKFLPIALDYFFLTASVTIADNLTISGIASTLGASIRYLASISFDPTLVAAAKENTLLNVAFIFAVTIHIYLFFSVIISLFMKYSTNFIKRVRISFAKEHDVLLDADEAFAFRYGTTFKHYLCWGKMNKEQFKQSNIKAPILNAFFNQKSLIHYVKFAKNRVNFISTTLDEQVTLNRLSVFANAYNQKPHYFKNVFFYVCASNENLDLYTSVLDVSEFKNHIILYSRYTNLAQKFISEHPISEIFSSEEMDYSRACLKDEASLTNFVLGFGNYNQEVLNQVLIHTNLFKVDPKTNKYVPYQVDTHLFDIKDIIVDQSADSNVGILISKKEAPHYKIFKHDKMNVFNQNFLDDIDRIINEDFSKEKKACYAFYVACGSDAVNVEIALDLKDRYSHKVHKMIIYCRVKSTNSVPLYRVNNAAVREKYQGIIFVGESFTIDNHDVIVNRSLESLAINKNIKYLQRTNKVSSTEALERWMSLPSIKRYNNSSVYLDLRFKLQLMGLDYCKKTDKGISKEQFVKQYLGNIDNYQAEFDRLLKYDYEDYYVISPVNNPRNLLAIAEHDRWNTYFESYGFNVMPLDQITYDYDPEKDEIRVKKDNIVLKLHACICDIEGLDKYHKHNAEMIKKLGEKYGVDLTKHSAFPSLTDTFYYDYDSFDEIYDVLKENGYSIIEK